MVTHPAAPSRKSIKPLAAAGDWERRKVNKYEALAAVHGAKVLGFSLESIGAWSGQAVSVVKILQKKAKGQLLGISSTDLYLSAIRTIAIAPTW